MQQTCAMQTQAPMIYLADEGDTVILYVCVYVTEHFCACEHDVVLTTTKASVVNVGPVNQILKP